MIINWFEKGSDRTRILKKNVLGVTIVRYSSYILEFIKVPILLSYLDNEKYGVWLTIVSIILWTNQFDMGLGNGLRYKFTESLANGDEKRGKVLVSTAYISMATIMFATFIICGLIFMMLNWNSILNVNSISQIELTITVVSVLALFLMQFIMQLISTMLIADQKASMASIFMPMGTILSLLCIIALKFIRPNSLLLASVFMSLPYIFILFIANMYFFNTKYKKYKPSFKCFHFEALKDIYSLGFKFFISQLSTLIVFGSSNIIIAHTIGPSDVTTYNIARQYFYVPITFITIFLVSFGAPITEAYVKGDMQWITNIMKRLKYIALFLSVAVLAMLFVSELAFDIWTHGKVQVPVNLSVSFAAYAILNMFASPYGEFLGGVGKFFVRMIFSLVKIAIFIPIALVFIKNFGLTGLVLAVCLVNTVPNIILGEIQYKKIVTGRATGIWNK